MQIPGIPSLVFLFYLLVLLPIAGIRSARRLSEPDGLSQIPSRETIWISTLVNLALMLGLAWFAGRGFGFPIFAIPHIRAVDLLAAAAALAICFGFRWLVRAMQPESKRRNLLVYKLSPRTPRESALSTAAVLLAAVAEEAAYRGVALSILSYSLGNPWIATLICAAAFAAAHWPQGTLSGVVIFAMALLMHALVGVTGTLVFAMIVHATYDFIAGLLIGREAARFDQEATSASAARTSSAVL